MKCFCCGTETWEYLCANCRTEEILDRVFEQIRYYKPDTCENPYLAEYVATLDEERSERNCIPEILKLFPEEVAEFYRCYYYWFTGNEQFESAAHDYLAKHPWELKKSQIIIYCLLKRYIRNDFIVPRKWCDWISENEEIYCELYALAAMYFAMIAEYDLADQMVDRGFACSRFLFGNGESMKVTLEKQKADTLRYRTKKPYWPNTEVRRRAVAMFYDEKGISYPRIDSKPEKIPEEAFTPIEECFDLPECYCAFWCAEAFDLAPVKPIYQIAAARVEDGVITDTFQSYIRPWDGIISRRSAAKAAGVPLSEIEGAEDVDQVMVKFFAFVGDAVLVSTGALGNQSKLISRAARYTGMKQIPNEFFDLLDMAAETDSRFDLENNNREFLLQYFRIPEGPDALGKAQANVAICKALKKYGA